MTWLVILIALVILAIAAYIWLTRPKTGLAMGLQHQTISGPGPYGQWYLTEDAAKEKCRQTPGCKIVSYDLDYGTAMLFNEEPGQPGMWIDPNRRGRVWYI